MAEQEQKWFKPEGVYGSDDRAQFRPKMRGPTILERKHLSKQADFEYFVPYIPLVICPDAPDLLAEYCNAHSRDVTFVHWKTEQQLFPSMLKSNVDTSSIFGIEIGTSADVFNFTNGIIVADESRQLVCRLLMQKLKIIEPGISLAAPQEKLLSQMIEVHIPCVQTPTDLWHAVVSSPAPVNFQLARNRRKGDPGLCKLMNKFWTRESDRSPLLEE